MTTKQLGNIGEAKTLAKFVEHNIPVYVAFGDNEKSDFIADFNGKLNRIQCKTSEFMEDATKIGFHLTTNTRGINGENKKHKYTKDEVDYFSLYNHESEILLLVPLNVLEGKSTVTFRIPWQPSRNQNVSLNYEDFTFEKIMCVETLHETPKE